MVVGVGDGLGRFLEIVELAQLVRGLRQDLLHGQADGALRIRDHAVDRHGQGVRDLAQQVGHVILARTVEAAREQDFAGERVAHDPQHILSLEGLEPVDGQDDPALLLEALLEPGLVREAQGEQLVVAFQQIGDGALGDSNLALAQHPMDFQDAAMLTVAQGADERDDVKPKFAVGQGPPAFLFGANRLTVVRTLPVMATADAQGEAADIVEGGDGPSRVVASPEGPPPQVEQERLIGSKVNVRVIGGRLVRRAMPSS